MTPGRFASGLETRLKRERQRNHGQGVVGCYSEARDLFVEKRDLIDCKAIQPGWSVCPADAALLRRGEVTTCISAAFVDEEEAENYCRYEVLDDCFPPVVIRSGE
ncbi:uncharacterized protein LOC119590003 [Penaeus monodon]|uniref:uncharacterized protein LOC119590003 n=1 Tax=Penaeus monodon TaxID=6687 RepID=UPI0018A6FE3B|nr:uncharacterized protein LOC119590003 [Penaeus monodon]